MNIQPCKTALYGATLAGLLVLSACGKSDEASNTTPTSPATSAPAPAAPAPASTAPAIPPASTTPAPSSSAPAPAPTQSSSQAAVHSGGQIRVAAVTLGSQVDAAHAISKEQRSFAPEEKAIYASVATIGTTDSATLNAKWSYQDGKDEPFTSTTESIATDGPAITTFKVQNPNAWPKGKYKVVISLNGRPVASEDFEVRG